MSTAEVKPKKLRCERCARILRLQRCWAITCPWNIVNIGNRLQACPKMG